MKELEFEFDDEIFEESNCRTNRVQGTYKPKLCDPEWFMQFSSEYDMKSDKQNIKKYQGDLLYQKHQYQEALVMYQESRQCVPLNNAVLDRELMESIAMCLLKLEKFDAALTLVKETMDDSHHNDSSMWYLLSRIYRAMGNVQGEIDALQRCATLHSWNYQYWFSLALAYERSSASCVKCVECDSDEKQTRRCLEHLAVGEQYTLSEHVNCNHTPFSTQLVDINGAQKHTKTSLCLNRTYLDFKKKNCTASLVLSKRKELIVDESTSSSNCLTIMKASVENKLWWRNHVLSFGCLIKTRFFLEKAVDASSSFAKDKCKSFLREVNDKISTHTDCGCVNLTDKVLELLYTSLIAGEQESPELGQSDTGTNKGCKQQENSASESGTTSNNFEQKWFGDLLSYMSGGS